MSADTLARTTDRADTARRLLVSARTPDSAAMPVDRVPGWLAERTRAGRFRVTRVPFAALRGWSFDGDGDLRHESGRFFAV
ncbi:NDP-hexose 2,3-dehydratase family protein, partial [Streptomyces sp. NPDC057242]